jgi:low affinity Fe/Cu permease
MNPMNLNTATASADPRPILSFRLCAQYLARAIGSPWAFFAAFMTTAAWAISGPVLHFSDTWQLIINTATSVLTFLMIFILQYSQNRDTRAIHVKLDKIIRGMHGANSSVVSIEDLSDEDLDKLQNQLERVRSVTNVPNGARQIAG